MSDFFSVNAVDTHSKARAGVLRFPSADGGVLEVETPAFMPVGTAGTVKGLWQEDLEEIGYGLILANTYHLFLRPGMTLSHFGGLKKFMSWNGALLTDSGGYQVFSLSERVSFLEEGVRFASHLDGSLHLFTPRSVVDFQTVIGSDIMMVLDDCPPGHALDGRIDESLDRTHRWAREAALYRKELVDSGRIAPTKRLFGIIQGAIRRDRRIQSAGFIQSLPFDGIAIGGLSVGESREEMHEVLEWLSPELDPARPHYLMGVGTIPDFLEAVRCGVDMFDCVIPTRNGRNGQIFTSKGRVNLRNASLAALETSPDPECSCRVCRRYSLGYLRHLFMSREMLGAQMATYHNLHFFHDFMKQMRRAIHENRFMEFYSRWKKISPLF